MSNSPALPREWENIVAGYVDASLIPVIVSLDMDVDVDYLMLTLLWGSGRLSDAHHHSCRVAQVAACPGPVRCPNFCVSRWASIRFTSPQASGLGGEPDLEATLPSVGKVLEKGTIVVPRDSEDSELHGRY